jgi:hypothetical protein
MAPRESRPSAPIDLGFLSEESLAEGLFALASEDEQPAMPAKMPGIEKALKPAAEPVPSVPVLISIGSLD